MRRDTFYIYILTNKSNTVLYVGVTNNIERRIGEHSRGQGSSFTARYNVKKCVYIETYSDIESAIRREKQLKAGPRKKKIALIEMDNPGWHDLFV